MKNLFKNIFLTLLILCVFSACQSVKDGLTGKKKTNSDEFLVKKKNPLSQPPDFGNLPVPITLNKNDDQNDSGISVKEILNKNSNTKNAASPGEASIGSLEKNILEKIKNN
jgi:hypothetical protein